MFTIPLYWVLGKSYLDGKLYHIFSLKWWKKGANYLQEVKYHILRCIIFDDGYELNFCIARALLTGSEACSQFRVLYDHWDGGSDNRNFVNFAMKV